MYSVVRFSEISIEQMKTLANSVDNIFPGFCANIKPGIRDNSCFSFSLIDDENWEKHHEAILNLLTHISSVLKNGIEIFPKLDIQIDTAVYIDDYEKTSINELLWTKKLIKIAAETSVSFAVTIYNTDTVEKIGS
jgi:hypothetical protein